MDGLVETITSRLTSLQTAREVFAVPASEVRRRGAATVVDAEREFGANLAVTGSVQRALGQLKLTVNLVDVANLRQTGSAIVTRPIGKSSPPTQSPRTIYVDPQPVRAIVAQSPQGSS